MIKNNYKFYMVAAFSIIIAVICPAQETGNASGRPLNVDDCIQAARKNNDTIKIQEQKILQSRQQTFQARSALLPNAAFTYQQDYRDNINGTAPGDGSASEFFASQRLFSGFRNKNGFEIARSNEYSAQLGLINTQRSLDSAVARAFYTLAQTESSLKNINNTLDMMSSREKELLEWVNLGKARESEIYMLQSQISILRSSQQKITGDRVNAARELAFLTGIEVSTISIADNAAEQANAEPADKSIEKAQNRADILAARENMNAQTLRVKAAKGNFLPTLDLLGGWYPGRTGSLAGPGWDANLLISVPLFAGGMNKARLTEEQEKLQEYTDALGLAQKEMETEVRQLSASLESSLQQVSALKDAYDKAQRSYALQLKDYSVGMVTNLDVIQATLTLLDVKNNLDSMILQAKLNKVLLDIAVK